MASIAPMREVSMDVLSLVLQISTTYPSLLYLVKALQEARHVVTAPHWLCPARAEFCYLTSYFLSHAGASGSGPNGGCAPYTLEIRDDCVVTLRDCVVGLCPTPLMC
jgi:hypothetical protein